MSGQHTCWAVVNTRRRTVVVVELQAGHAQRLHHVLQGGDSSGGRNGKVGKRAIKAWAVPRPAPASSACRPLDLSTFKRPPAPIPTLTNPINPKPAQLTATAWLNTEKKVSSVASLSCW